MNYTLFPKINGKVVREDGKVVAPCQSHDDPDFLEYKEWVMSGNEPDINLAEDPNPPEYITARQLRLALNKIDRRHYVEDAIKLCDINIRDEWEFGTEFTQQNAVIVYMSENLHIDTISLFVLAETL